jgi:hypothetical protein
VEYLLKADFSTDKMLERVRKWLPKTAPAAPGPRTRGVLLDRRRAQRRIEVTGHTSATLDRRRRIIQEALWV